MGNWKGLLCAVLSLLALSSCAAPAAPAASSVPPEPWESAEIFLSYATSQGERDTPSYDSINEALLNATEGRIYCNTYAGGSMGGDQDLMQAVRSGAISVVQLSTSSQVKVVPELALLDTPYLFADRETCNEQLSGALLEFFQPYYNREGMQLLAWYCPGFRQLTCDFPVEKPADLPRLRIRILDSKYHQVYWSALGAEPVSIPFSNLFYAIQQGVVNAQENPANAAISQNLQQLQSCIVLTDHLPFISAVVMNKECYDALSPQDRETVTQVFRDSCAALPTMLSGQELKKYFDQVVTPSAALRTGMEAGAQAVEEALRADLGADVAGRFYTIVRGGDAPPGTGQGQ